MMVPYMSFTSSQTSDEPTDRPTVKSAGLVEPWAYLTGGPGGHVPPQIVGPGILSGPKSKGGGEKKKEKEKEKKKRGRKIKEKEKK